MLDSRLAEHSNSSPLLSNYRDEKAYILFISSLKSKYTKIKYDGCLQKYLKFEANRSVTSLDQVLKKDPKVIEGEIIEQLIEMKNKGMSFSTLSVHLAAMHSFFSINDISINIRKLSRFVGEQESKYEYRPYTHEEIAKLLALCDERGKAIVMLLSSTGMRVGAIPELKLRHIKRYNLPNESHVYRIMVYPNSKKSKHITFCTPECAQLLDEYLEYRNRIIQNNVRRDYEKGEWGPPDAYLITRQFDMNEVPSSSDIFKRPVTAQGLRSYIVSRLKKLNLRSSWKEARQNSNTYIASHKNELHPCHSFRIFAITQMQRAKIDKTIREMLVGHSTGLDSVYYKASEEEIYLEYLKAIDNLTISNDHKLQPWSKETEQEKITKIKEKHEADLVLIREEMKLKFDQIFSLIQQNPLLAHVKPEVLTKPNK